MVQVQKKDKETVESLIRRFKKRLLQSGTVFEARRRRFYERPKSRNQLREEAQRRTKIRKEKEHLRKIGKIDSRGRAKGRAKH